MIIIASKKPLKCGLIKNDLKNDQVVDQKWIENAYRGPYFVVNTS